MRKKGSITLSASLEEKAALEKIAFKLGYRWGTEGNVSALFCAIAAGEIVLRRPKMALDTEDYQMASQQLKQIEAATAALSSMIDPLHRDIS